MSDICPRCGEIIDGYPALSRVDNKTNICSPCGMREALWDFAHRDTNDPMPPVDRPIETT
jgi:hypothetical protein